MTTLRERLERGEIEYVKKYFELHNISYPMCCWESKQLYMPVTGKVVNLYKCSWLKDWYTFHSFKEKCKECVEYMKGILSEYIIKEGEIEVEG